MNPFLDFLPLLLFFLVYAYFGIFVATAVAIAGALFQILWMLYQKKTPHILQWLGLGLVMVLGGSTLIWHNPIFIKWKPTLVHFSFALAFAVSEKMDRPILKSLLPPLEISKTVMKHIHYAWIVFFIAMGLLNLYIAYQFSEETWVRFKVFGLLPLTFVFVLLQAWYLSHHTKSYESSSLR